MAFIQKLIIRRLKPKNQSQRGAFLLEALVAAAILGTGILAGLSAISTSAIATHHTTEKTTASWIATSQADLIRSLPYVPTGNSYTSVPTPTDFTVSNTTSVFPGGDGFIQNVDIIVSKNGNEVLRMEMVKVDR
jgi:Tfp pilus assembly protein PilV